MPQPIVQRIVSVYNDEGLQAYLKALREIRAAEKELGRLQQAQQREERERTNTTRRTTSEQQKAMRLIKQVVKEARAEFNLLNEANRQGRLSAVEFSRETQRLTANAERNLQRIRGAMGRVGSGAALEFKQAEVALQRFVSRTHTEVTGMSRLRTRIGAGVGDALGQQAGGVYSQLGLITRGLAVVRGGFQATFAGAAVYAVGRAGVALERFTQRARQFQREMAAVAIAGDASVASMNRLERGVIDIASRVGGGNISEFTRAINDIRQAGFDGGEGLQILEVSARSAVGGVTDVATAADLLTSVLASYKLPASEAARVSDLLFQAAKDGKTTLPEMARSIGQVAPVAAAANVSLEELLASVATLTASGLSTSESMTRTRAVIAAIVDPTKEAATMAKSLGLEFGAEALASKGLTGVLEDVRQATGGNVETMAQLFGSVEALEAAIQLAGRQADAFARNLEGMRKSAGAATEAYREMKRTADFLSDTLRNRFDAILIRLSEKSLPAYNAALRTMLRLMDSFQAPGERTLALLKEMEGVNPAVIRRLELQVNTDHLREQQRRLQSQFEGRSFKFLPERGRDRVLGGGALTGQRLIRFDAVETSEAELRQLRERITESILEINRAVEAGAGRLSATKLLNAYERQLEDLDEVLRLRTNLTAVTQALAEAEGELAQRTAPIPAPRTAGGMLDRGALLQGMFAAGAPAETPQTIAERIAALKEERDALVAKGVATERLAELNRMLQRLQERQRDLETLGLPNEEMGRARADAEQLITAFRNAQALLKADPAVRSHLEEILRLDGEILDLEERIAKLRGQPEAAGLQEIADGKKARRDALRASMMQREQLQAFADALPAMRIRPPDMAHLAKVMQESRLAEQMNDVLEQVNADVEAVKIELGFGNITPEDAQARIAALTDAAREELRRIYEAFRALLPPEARQKIEAFLSGIGKGAGEASKGVQKAGQAFEALASSGRAALRLADALGLVSDELSNIVGGALDAVDAIGQIEKTRAAMDAGDLSGFAGTASLAMGYIGLAAGVATAVTGFIGAIRSSDERRKEETRRFVQAMGEHRAALERFTQELFDAPVFGRDLSRRDLSAAEAIVAELRTGEAGEDPEAVRSRLRSLQDLGLVPDDTLDAFDRLFERFGSSRNAVLWLLRDLGIDDLLSALTDSLGGFGGTIDGFIEEMTYRRERLGQSASEILDVLIERLYSGRLDLGGPLTELLKRMLGGGIDYTTSEGQERLAEVVDLLDQIRLGILDPERVSEETRAILTEIFGVGFGEIFDALSPADYEKLVEFLEGLSEAPGAGEAHSSQVSRVITEYQAGALLSYQRELVYWESEQARLLLAILNVLALPYEKGDVNWHRNPMTPPGLGSVLTNALAAILAPPPAFSPSVNVTVPGGAGGINVNVVVNGQPRKLTREDYEEIMSGIEYELRKNNLF